MMAQIVSHRPLRQRQPRIRNERHLRVIRRLPCLTSYFSGSEHNPIEAAHVRFADASRDKRETGKAEKPDDKWTVPLSQREHTAGPGAQHRIGERQWWENHGIDVLALCERLYSVWDKTSDEEEAEQMMRAILRRST